MDFAFTEDQLSIGELANTILDREITIDRLKAAEQVDGIDTKAWHALATAGLVGVALSEDVGGGGMGMIEAALVLQSIGRHVAPVPVWSSVFLGALPLDRFGSEAQRQALIPGVATGDIILTAALEELANANPASPSTQARRVDAGFELYGTKTCVPFAATATKMLVPARSPEGSTTVFLVDPTANGVTLAQQRTTAHEAQYQVDLEGVTVTAADIVGAEGGGAEVLSWMIDRATVGLCAMQLGVAERALEMTADYTKTRHQFGRPIANFQAVRQRAADAYIDVEAMRLTLWQAVWRLDVDVDADLEVATAKFWAAEGAQRVVHAAQHLHGGIGVDVDYPLHRYFLWAKQIELTLGHGTEQLLRIGRIFAASPA